MTALGPDEKVCPYCAETIKAAAVRCRYCHSDLTDAPPAPPSEGAPPTEGAKSSAGGVRPTEADRGRSTADDTARSAPETGGDHPADEPALLGSFRLLRILVAVCLVLALVTAVAWWYSRHQSDTVAQGPITSVQARDAGIAAASKLTETVLSYDWKTLAKDTKAAEAVMGPSFRSEYAKAMAGVKKQTLKNKVQLEAKAVATSVVSASDHKVVALVFVNQVTTAKGAQNQRLDQNRVLVTLTRGEGEWRVSKMDAF